MGGNSLHVGDRLAMTANEAFYVTPPNWQPTGDTITPDHLEQLTHIDDLERKRQ